MPKLPDAWKDREPPARKQAAWWSTCAWCDEEIDEGEWIVRLEKFNNEWVHEECARKAEGEAVG